MGHSKKTYKLKKKNDLSHSKKNFQDSIQANIKTNSNKKTLSINIGIDFGTSYTKVCFSYIKDFSFVKFFDSNYKKSILFYDNNKKELLYSKPENSNNLEEIKYFKYSMIDDSLPKSMDLQALNLQIKPEILCSVFFLACLINESKASAENYFSKSFSGDINYEWNITMGVPIDNYEDDRLKKSLYDKILNIAYRLSNYISSYNISINSLLKCYEDNINMIIPKVAESNINTLPELYAESLAFLQDRNVSAGVYVLVDIGGGTVDMAVMYKEDAENYSIVSERINPLGIEIICNSVVRAKDFIDNVKKELKGESALSSSSYIYKEKEKELKEQFKQAFATIVVEARNKAEKALLKQNGKLPIIICGGGVSHKWYKDGILNTKEQLRPTLGNIDIKLEIWPVQKLLPESKIVDINHRLLIAYALAQRIEDIPHLAGFPWHFNKNNAIPAEDRDDLNSKLLTIQNEKYPK